MKGRELMAFVAAFVDDKRAIDITALDISRQSAFADYFVIATVTSSRQMQTIAESLRREMKQHGNPVRGIEGVPDGGWTLIDLGNCVVHLFTEDARSFYNIEGIWVDAQEIDWRQPMAAPARKSPRRKSAS